MCHPAWARARTEARRPKDLTEEPRTPARRDSRAAEAHGETDVLAKTAEVPEADRVPAVEERTTVLVTRTAG
ncbi:MULTISPECIES: hypothetical protein [unclassified Streptomyces]|uniref:hypothetical protein n=1 Tax=unclassified Streptomyces TaxID=2593676 RepID=UPI0033A9E812